MAWAHDSIHNRKQQSRDNECKMNNRHPEQLIVGRLIDVHISSQQLNSRNCNDIGRNLQLESAGVELAEPGDGFFSLTDVEPRYKILVAAYHDHDDEPGNEREIYQV